MMTWEQLWHSCHACTKCKLSDTRTRTVFGTGNPNASVLFVGEAPNDSENQSGEPFVGEYGQLFDEFLSIINLSRRTNIYLTNIVKCRPPKSRGPFATECQCCLDFLRHQVLLVNPKIIVCVGQVVASTLIDPDFHLAQDHGAFYEKKNILMSGLYHPNDFVRDSSLKLDMLEDLKKLQLKIKEICPETYG